MEDVIRDLLDYSRLGRQRAPQSPVNLELVLAHALTDLRPHVTEADAQVTHDPLPTVVGCECQLRRLFQNLIGNALKYRIDQRPEIHIGACLQEQEWLFSVRDNGIGISPEHQERIFEVFQRANADAKRPGAGIGLAVCRRVVEHHGGRIWVESMLGQGATFFFTLPAASGFTAGTQLPVPDAQ